MKNPSPNVKKIIFYTLLILVIYRNSFFCCCNIILSDVEFAFTADSGFGFTIHIGYEIMALAHNFFWD